MKYSPVLYNTTPFFFEYVKNNDNEYEVLVKVNRSSETSNVK